MALGILRLGMRHHSLKLGNRTAVGRRFSEEIQELEETHRFACTTHIDVMVQGIRASSRNCLFATGSGGSLTTAHIAAQLHRELTGKPGFAVTPLELAACQAHLRGKSVLIATAGGSNSDAIGAMRVAIDGEADRVLALCLRLKSKLSVEASRGSNVSLAEFHLATPGDGFLATNSLWASAVLLHRAYWTSIRAQFEISPRLSSIVGMSWKRFVDETARKSEPIWKRSTIVVLYGPSSAPIAIDLESKLTEAALSNVWIADYRHFAHGRHHWLAKRAATTSVIAFIAEEESELAKKTLTQIPTGVPVLRLEIPKGPTSMLYGLAHVFPIVLASGNAVGIDPGRPGVPPFGRRIYRLNAFARGNRKPNVISATADIAIERKAGTSIEVLRARNDIDFWKTAFFSFTERLHKARFDAVVFDFDGTLCSLADRHTGIGPSMSKQLTKLLKSGLVLGVATGRGISVRESLRKEISKKYWSAITLGYYNGAQIATLADDEFPIRDLAVCESLKPLLAALQASNRLTGLGELEARHSQITISSRAPEHLDECWDLAIHIASLVAPGAAKLVRSTHSFDILPVAITKLAVIERLQGTCRDEILAIGDMGRWPGNDFELLSHLYSLSVDQVSSDLATCWNIAAPGSRGCHATLEYLSRMQVSKGKMRFRGN